MQEFKFDYDKENNDLFIYNDKFRSSASIEIGDLVLDFNRNKGLAGIEIMNATRFLTAWVTGYEVSRAMLSDVISCKVESKILKNLLLIRMTIVMKKAKIPLNLTVPTITRASPASAS